MGILSSLLGPWRPSAAADSAGSFCSSEFPQMWHSFVDHLVDSAYTRSCTATADPQPRELPPFRLPAAKRLVAIGDLHGDLEKALRAFRLAGLVDDLGRWAGGDTVCVQVGDILDRGDQELKLLFLLERLQQQAEAAGGALHVLNGNHETMNVGGNYKYATAGADVEMAAWTGWTVLGQRLKEQCSSCRDSSSSRKSISDALAGATIDAARVADTPGPDPASTRGRTARQYNPQREAALKPGGPITRRFFAPHPTVLQVGSTLFAHGGILPHHVQYGLENINGETRKWLMGPEDSSTGNSGGGAAGGGGSGDSGGERPARPEFLFGPNAIVWARDYSARSETSCKCDQLAEVLEAIPGAKRMVVGHTIQDKGINSACDGQVLRVDVGLSKGCGNGEVQVLEITEDGNKIVRLIEGMEPQVVVSPDKQQQQQHQQQQQQQQPSPQKRSLVVTAAAVAAREQQQEQQQQPTAVPAAAVLGSWWRQQMWSSTRAGVPGSSGISRTGKEGSTDKALPA